jgi:hypothetical protein
MRGPQAHSLDRGFFQSIPGSWKWGKARKKGEAVSENHGFSLRIVGTDWAHHNKGHAPDERRGRLERYRISVFPPVGNHALMCTTLRESKHTGIAECPK